MYNTALDSLNDGNFLKSLYKTRVLLCSTAVLLLSIGTVRADTLTEVTDFGSNPGNLRMYKYIPDDLQEGRPLVVALHGCNQRASGYDDETGWVQLANRWQFALLLPEQQSDNNASLCFNWFNGDHFLYDWFFWSPDWGNDIDRDKGETFSIKEMIEQMNSDHRVDSSRVFVTGLSAGGAMTAVMLATYPELFAGGAIIAGVPYKCALTSGDALSSCGVDINQSASVPIQDLSPNEWGVRVRNASDHQNPWPKVSIWHGEADQTVIPVNARELLEQWTNVHGIDAVPDVEETVKGHPHKVYQDAEGNAWVETFNITGMGHGTPVDPGTAEEQCGTAAQYILDANICSSFFIGKFWGLDKTD